MKVLLKYLATYSNAIHVYARKIENLKQCSLFSVPSPPTHLYTVYCIQNFICDYFISNLHVIYWSVYVPFAKIFLTRIKIGLQHLFVIVQIMITDQHGSVLDMIDYITTLPRFLNLQIWQ